MDPANISGMSELNRGYLVLGSRLLPAKRWRLYCGHHTPAFMARKKVRCVPGISNPLECALECPSSVKKKGSKIKTLKAPRVSYRIFLCA